MVWTRKTFSKLPEKVRATSRLALMLIADYANEDAECWPSIKRLSEEMGCSESTVRRSLAELVQLNLLVVMPRTAQYGRQTSNAYRLTMVEDFAAPAEEAEQAPTPADPAAPAAPAEHPIFANAAQQDDRGQPAAAQGTGGARQFAMTLDWQPEAKHWEAETLRRGDPSLTWDRGELADFTAHFADKANQTNSSRAWCAKFARWASDNRKRQAAQQARADQNNAKNNARTAGGSTHASHRPTGPVRNASMSAAEGRAYLEQQRRQAQAGDAPGGDILDGEWSS
ncbi:helix-turn-helix domain-containing protein [Cobetia sp. 29-18-1]|uniref:helix-turn-helix domain-containing protein n=1 Tax=Cobetia sp. 29-18-1 TaxID=3040018 RepID=UPI002449050E|nr:helix-turn-helix domain-containing protein [Cobetia sp. 29-18-1]MDH2299807.1 DnaT-like ssDNA-binding domain-containing protein [Cobetia sp. 29-18-1]